MRRIISCGPAILVLLVMAGALLVVPEVSRRAGYARTSAQIVLARAVRDDDDILDRINAAVRSIATSVLPSVVHVESFASPRSSSTGSGWVYDDLGHVVTNAHVVRDAQRIVVQFSDGRVVGASVVGRDSFTDIAVLRVSTDEGLFPTSRATHEPPHQGDRVFAFGSPFGFKFSMSEGIVSGLGRDPSTAIGRAGFTNFIQTDAAVNPGNSGGPLVDIHGKVIGMSVAIATGRDNQGTNEGQSAGIGFAIPLPTIESVVDQLIAHGSVARGFLGIRYNAIGGQVVIEDDSGRTIGPGLMIDEVTPGAPAALAGLQSGDVIAEIAGQALTSVEVLRSAVGPAKPGDELPVRVWRDGKFLDLTVVLGEFPPESLARQSLLRFGLVFEDSETGPIVSALTAVSAFREGFRRGQLVLSVGERSVASADEVYDALIKAGILDGKAASVQVLPPDADNPDQAKRFQIRLTP